jgi:hypothetical protein
MISVKSIAKTAIIMALIPVAVVAGLVALPFLCVLALFRWVDGVRVRKQLSVRWPAGKVGVLVYSQSPLWAPTIEQELLPHIGSACVVVNRTSEPQWKRVFRLECRAQELWLGSVTYCPVVMLIPPRGKILSFQLFEAFREHKHGNDQQLKSQIGSIREAFAPYITA